MHGRAWALGAAVLLSACVSGDREPTAEPRTLVVTTPPEVAVETRSVPEVVVNGRPLTDTDLDAFKTLYGAAPAAGRWWYDATSGMYGAEGQGAAGFMYAGHDLGPLAADASRGSTQVFINGRQLTIVEVNTLAGLVGGAVMPGRYWLDGQLNWGYEGVPYPVGNLRQLAAARGAGGSGGDTTWSGLVGSGNSDQGNSRGYVSIPGVGPIGSYGVD
jgi:hypothetical protein